MVKTLTIYLLLGGLGISSFADEDSSKKTYTEKDFETEVMKRVDEKLMKAITRIKKKSVAELTKEVLNREKEIKKREQELKLKEERLENSIKDFERKITEFEHQQTQFIACVDNNNKEKEQRIKKMVEVIANMKPAKAAELIGVQDQDIAVSILSKLATEQASKIFNLLSKEKSAELQKLYLNMKK